MQKGLCFASLIVSLIVLIAFLLDIVFGMLDMTQLAPFKYANMMIDIVFLLCGSALAYMSWLTLKEQV